MPPKRQQPVIHLSTASWAYDKLCIASHTVFLHITKQETRKHYQTRGMRLGTAPLVELALNTAKSEITRSAAAIKFQTSSVEERRLLDTQQPVMLQLSTASPDAERQIA